MMIYITMAIITFLIFQIIILQSPYNKPLCKVFSETIFNNYWIGEVYEAFLEEEPEEELPRTALAVMFFIVWGIFTLVSIILAAIWPVSIFFLLFMFIFHIKNPFKTKNK